MAANVTQLHPSVFFSVTMKKHKALRLQIKHIKMFIFSGLRCSFSLVSKEYTKIGNASPINESKNIYEDEQIP